jgi:hypothetical protein
MTRSPNASSNRIRLAVALALALAPAWAEPPLVIKEHRMTWLGGRVSDSDVLLWLGGLEYAVPTKLGITSKWVHELAPRGEAHPFRAVTLNTGTDGARLGLGYGAMFSGAKVLSGAELRATVVRTWHDPLKTGPARTLVGPEGRVMLFGFLSVGLGHYWQVSPSQGKRDAFFGLQAGVGF